VIEAMYMKMFFAKLRVFTALNDGKPIPTELRDKAARSEELRRFTENAEKLDVALRATTPEPGILPSLHSSIMRAVRRVERAQPRQKVGVPWWLPASALPALVVVILWWGLQAGQRGLKPADTTQPLAAAGEALEMGDEFARTVPSSVVMPVADELDRFQRDLDSTTDFLLASIP
jgi:hypothetical protein